MKQPKVALVHEYLTQHGGAEKTFEAIAELFPDAPIYTGVYDPKNFSDLVNKRKIYYPKNFIFKSLTKYVTPLMPLVFEGFDLREYDIILSDGHCWAKGVLTKPGQLHVSYIHTPPRFLYKYSVESTKRNKWYFKPAVSVIDMFLRAWDFAAAQRPNFLLANSDEVRKRIKKFYNRDSQVMYPPVEVAQIGPKVKAGTGDYYLALGRLVAYKNFDVLIEAFNILKLPLIVAGTGLEEAKLKSIAGPTIKFEGRVSEERKKELLQNCLGVINPVEDEDFGVVPVEAMSYGKPVLTHKSGGHLETIVENESGMFFEDKSPEKLAEKIKEFDSTIKAGRFDPVKMSQKVQKFSKERFQKEFKNFVFEKYA